MKSNINQLAYSPGEDLDWRIIETSENLWTEDGLHIENKGIADILDICGIWDYSNIINFFSETYTKLEIFCKTSEVLIKKLTDTEKVHNNHFCWI